MMRIFATSVLSFFLFQTLAQTSVSFNNLGNATFQNNYQNPALIPSQDLFIGIPVISGIHLNINNNTSYNETFTNSEESTVVDITKVLKNLQNQNMFSAQADINLFHVGIKTKSGRLISLSARERVEAALLVSKELVDYIWNGNERYTNQDVNVAKLGVKAMHFREFGLGYAMPINKRIDFGIRGKFLVGFTDVSLPKNFFGSVNSNGEVFQVDAEFKNLIVQTSGISILEGRKGDVGSHFLLNKNMGVGIDLGVKYRLSKNHTITASLLDVGFINWKEALDNEQLKDTTFYSSGRKLNSVNELKESFDISLFSRFQRSPNSESYLGWLPIKAYGSWIYHRSRNRDIYFSMGMRIIQRQLKMLYGIGLTQKFGSSFTANITATKLPHQFVNLGSSFVVSKGPVQFYVAADQAVNFSLPNVKAFDFRFGLNLAIVKRDDGLEKKAGKGTVTKNKGIDSNVFLGKRVKTKKREGIYAIIKKQKKRKLENNKSPKNQKVKTKSLNGHSGKKNIKNN